MGQGIVGEMLPYFGPYLLVGFLGLLWAIHEIVPAPGAAPLPPGPKGRYPLVGMMFDMPDKKPWYKLAEWARLYGPVMHIRLGTQHFIYLNDAQTSRDLLDKRSAVFSDRPPSLVGEIVSSNLRTIQMPYGELWRRIRKCLNAILTVKKCDSYIPVQANEAIHALKKIVDDPDNFFDHLGDYSLSVARSVAYGRRIISHDDKFAEDINQVSRNFTEYITPGNFIIETVPWLQNLPRSLQPWMPKLEAFRDFELKVYLGNYKQAIADSEIHPNRPCIARDIKREMVDTGDLTDVQAALTCGDVLGAGSDTTTAQILVVIQACIAFPSVLKKAHEELDRVVGPDRFPTWDDEPNLPYIRSMIKEGHRWRPVAPLSFPRYLNTEEKYNGYRLPRNSIVITNTWAIHMNPERYPAPDVFYPERFLNHNLSAGEYANMSDVSLRDHFNYGGGRRICVGLQLAERSLFMMISRLLHAFEILPALGPDGKEIPVDIHGYGAKLASVALPFKARFQIRNEKIGNVISDEHSQLFSHSIPESWTTD